MNAFANYRFRSNCVADDDEEAQKVIYRLECVRGCQFEISLKFSFPLNVEIIQMKNSEKSIELLSCRNGRCAQWAHNCHWFD